MSTNQADSLLRRGESPESQAEEHPATQDWFSESQQGAAVAGYSQTLATQIQRIDALAATVADLNGQIERLWQMVDNLNAELALARKTDNKPSEPGDVASRVIRPPRK